MKGQLGMDVIIAIIIFVTFVSYLFLQLSTLRPRYLHQIEAERIRAEAYQLSELLINDPGEPADWTYTNVKRVGLSDEKHNLTNLISWSKVVSLSSLCKNYERVREKIGVVGYQFMIRVRNLTSWSGGSLSITCYPPLEIIQPSILNFTVRRIVGIITPTEERVAGEVIVAVW